MANAYNAAVTRELASRFQRKSGSRSSRNGSEANFSDPSYLVAKRALSYLEKGEPSAPVATQAPFLPDQAKIEAGRETCAYT